MAVGPKKRRSGNSACDEVAFYAALDLSVTGYSSGRTGRENGRLRTVVFMIGGNIAIEKRIGYSLG